jgi:hypothetical protein
VKQRGENACSKQKKSRKSGSQEFNREASNRVTSSQSATIQMNRIGTVNSISLNKPLTPQPVDEKFPMSITGTPANRHDRACVLNQRVARMRALSLHEQNGWKCAE